MSVCDVPVCPSISVGGASPLMGAPKGVPRVNRASNETRDRLRIRLNKRKETLRTLSNLSKKALQNDSETNSSATESNLSETLVKPTGFIDYRLTAEDKPIMNMIKKAGLNMCFTQPCTHTCLHKGSNKKGEVKSVSEKGKGQNVTSKDKENMPVDELETNECNKGHKAKVIDDIDRIMEYIEGKDTEVVAEKKAAKKARQKQKKEEARRKKEEEEEARRKAEEARILEEKRKEEERLKAEMLARIAAQKKAAKKNKNQPVPPSTLQESSKTKKKNKKNKNNIVDQPEPELLEETIPAMVTIKRIVENNNAPPLVTITLKGSTPDQDKLLYTLVNGHNNPTSNNNFSKEPPKQKTDSKSGKKKNKKVESGESVTTNEMQVTLAVDKSFRKELENKNEKKSKKASIPPPQQADSKKSKNKEVVIDIPSLKLPPGITITKVNGPLTNKKVSNTQTTDYQNVPVNKSGVIVVDTEKLIQQSNNTKKNKKKKKKGGQNTISENVPAKSDPAMVTLKNPIFHRLQNNVVTPPEPLAPHMINMNEQATISRGANGMVTIRRPRHVPMESESPEYLAPVMQPTKPFVNEHLHEPESTLSDERKIIRPPSPRPSQSNVNTHNSTDILTPNGEINNMLFWGLPGIQITKVNKQQINENEANKHRADVSITCTGRTPFNLEKDDWLYESVFTPKDELEEDLDAEERELEAFKRFCQQSIPPKHKEKVAHLNVKDIVLMKKNDVTYS